MSGVTKDGKLKPYKKRMRWDAILDRLPKKGKIRGAEIGVLNGNTAARILRARPGLILIMIDPWCVPPADSSYAKQADCNARKSQREHDAAYRRTLKVTAFAGARAKIWRIYSSEAVVNVKDYSLDFVFIDGDHSYAGTSLDIRLWNHKVKPGGFICGHDYEHETRPDLAGVTKAWNEAFPGKIEKDSNHTCFVRL